MIEIGNGPHYFVAFALLLARVGGLMVFAPFWGSFSVARQVRIILALALAAALFPVVGGRIEHLPSGPAEFVLAGASELAIGLMLGLVGQLFMGVLQLAGTVMGFQMGFSLVNVIDPQTNVEISVLGVLYNLAGMMLFVIMGAHLWFFQALVDSYDLIPPLTAHLSGALFEIILDISANFFYLGVQLALPVVLVGITIDILLGIVGRAAPQIHILIAGLPVKVLVGFVMVTLTAQTLLPFFRRNLTEVHENLYLVLRAMGG